MNERRQSPSHRPRPQRPQPKDRTLSVVTADLIRKQIQKRPLVHSERERLIIAENLWEILDAATKQKTELSAAKILHEAGQGKEEESTKRLSFFAVKPTLPIEDRLRRASKLRRHVDRYVHIAMTAATAAGMSTDSTLVQLFSRTTYEQGAPADAVDPFDEALADLLVALEKDFEGEFGDITLAFVGDYYKNLRRLRVTTSLNANNEKGWVSPNALIWRNIWPGRNGVISVPDPIRESIPFAPIGMCSIAEVPGSISIRAGDFDPANTRVHVAGDELLAPRESIELPARINICGQVSLALFPLNEGSLPRLVLLVKPSVYISAKALPYIGVEVGPPDSWQYYGLWSNDGPDSSDVAATSRSFCLFESLPCQLFDVSGELAANNGYIEAVSCTIREEEAVLKLSSELHHLGRLDSLVLPLTLETMRKWLMYDMLDDEYSPVTIAKVDWAPFASFASGIISGLRNVMSPSNPPQQPPHQEEPRELDLIAGSFPEGTMAAALERGMIAYRGKKIGPFGILLAMASAYSAHLGRAEELAVRRRRGIDDDA